jgi:hypothetical protein
MPDERIGTWRTTDFTEPEPFPLDDLAWVDGDV